MSTQDDVDLPEQVRVRREKYDRLVAAGTPPYPLGHPRTATLAEVRERYADLPTDSASGDVVSVTGRVVLSRTGGKLCFATLQEGGAQLQVMVSLDGVGQERLDALEGRRRPRRPRRRDRRGHQQPAGELSVLATRVGADEQGAAAAARQAQGLTDPEAAGPPALPRPAGQPGQPRAPLLRAQVVRSLRASFPAAATSRSRRPMLQVVHGGAAARPFKTHVNALDLDVSLRIALELT